MTTQLASADIPLTAAVDPLQQGVGRLNICFFTKVEFPVEVPDTIFAIPANTTPQGLNALINDLISTSMEDIKPSKGKNNKYQAQPFDFLIGDEFVCVAIDKFLRRRGISAEGTIKVEFIPAMRAQEGSKLPHDDWVASVTCPIAGQAEQCFVTASYDRIVRVWQDEQCVANGASHIDAVKSVAFRPGSVTVPAAAMASGNRRQRGGADALPEKSSFEFVSGGKDGTIRLWTYEAPTKLSCTGYCKAHINGIDSVAVSQDGNTIATGSWDTTVKVWDLASISGSKTAVQASAIQPQLSFSDHTRPVLATAFVPNGVASANTNGKATAPSTRLCSTGLDGTVKTYNLEKGQVESTGPASHAAQCLSVRAAEGAGDQSALILTGHTDSRIRLLDTRSNRIASAWSGHRQWIYSVCWLQRDDDPAPMTTPQPLIASASEDATVRVWDMRSTYGALMTFDKIHNDGVLCVTYGGASTIVSCGKDNRTKTVTVTKND